MSIFSTNQARHLYVATAYKTPKVIATDAAGSIAVKSDTDKTQLSFEYKSVDGLVRSDLIDVKNIISAKATDATKMARNLKKATVTINGTPVKGEDYILKIAIRQFAGMSDEDIYTKFGMVHATDGMTASEFYKELALSLAKNFSRELTKLFKFALTSGSGESVTETVVDETTKAASLTGTYTSLVITEVEQEWVLGIKPLVPVYFDVLAGDWGSVVAENSTEVVGNGKNIADLEYFCMGERGDIYRGVGYPNNIKTTYMVDASKTYSVLDIHYAYVGSNESVQKSEKTITIVCDNKTTLNNIIGAVKTATGLNIATL